MGFYLNRSKRYSEQIYTKINNNKDKLAVAIIFQLNGNITHYYFKNNMCYFKSNNDLVWSSPILITDLSWYELSQIKTNLNFIQNIKGSLLPLDSWFKEQEKKCVFKLKKKLHHFVWEKTNPNCLGFEKGGKT